MGHPRQKPKHLPAKLLAIRHRLGVSQAQMAKLLEFDKGAARMSEYETGIREPDLLVLFSYAKLVQVTINILVDEVELRFPHG